MNRFAHILMSTEQIGAIPLTDIPEVLGELERIRAHLWARLALSQSRESPCGSVTTSTQQISAQAPSALLKVPGIDSRPRAQFRLRTRLSWGNSCHSVWPFDPSFARCAAALDRCA